MLRRGEGLEVFAGFFRRFASMEGGGKGGQQEALEDRFHGVVLCPPENSRQWKNGAEEGALLVARHPRFVDDRQSVVNFSNPRTGF